MYVTYNKVRAHDTDLAGILYFPRQFRFVQDALEDLLADEGIGMAEVFKKEHFYFVIVHAEADYILPLSLGDELEIHTFLEKIGTTSFITCFDIYRKGTNILVGKCKTVHVTLCKELRKKIPLPEHFKVMISKYLKREEGERGVGK